MYQVSLHIYLSKYSVVLLSSFFFLDSTYINGVDSYWQSCKIQGLNFSYHVDHSLRKFQRRWKWQMISWRKCEVKMVDYVLKVERDIAGKEWNRKNTECIGYLKTEKSRISGNISHHYTYLHAENNLIPGIVVHTSRGLTCIVQRKTYFLPSLANSSFTTRSSRQLHISRILSPRTRNELGVLKVWFAFHVLRMRNA